MSNILAFFKLNSNQDMLSYFIFFKLSHAVSHFVEALHYKPEGCELDSRWGQLDL